jgi:lipopolysaccharide transport system ATP-binding protein
MISVKGLSKHFRLYRQPSDRLKEMVLRRTFHRTHVALDAISFEVASGETLGILGRNGAGKSTLLKILTGVLKADSGSFDINGRVTGLLELGTGFDYELSGEANILTNGLLLGMSREEIEQRRDDIVQFSELGEFIREPLRTYSSGMVMRLAFSIAIHAEPACLVVDEALSVGDAHFQQKCMRRIRDFRERGGSIIFVSHDLNSVKMLCDRAIVLEGGRNVFSGEPEAAVNHYNRLIADEDDRRELESPDRKLHVFGNGLVEIESASVLGETSGAAVLSSGEGARIVLDCLSHETIEDMTAGFVIRDRFGQDVFGTNSFHLEQPIPMTAGQRRRLEFTLPMELAPGRYTLTAALHSRENHLENCYYWCDSISRFEVAGVRGALFAGVCRLPTDLRVTDIEA